MSLSKFNFKFNFNKDIFIISLFATAYLVLMFFANTDFSLTHFTKIVFSEASLNAVDIDKRVSFFYKLVFLSSTILYAIYLVLSFIHNKTDVFRGLLAQLSVFSFVGLFSIFATVVGINSSIFTNLVMIICVLCIVNKLVFANFSSLSFFKYNTNFSLILITALQVLFALIFLFNSVELVYKHVELLYVFSFLSVTVFVLFLQKLLLFQEKQIHIVLSALAVVPLAVFFSTEMLLLIKQNSDVFIRYKFVFAAILLLTIAFTMLFAILKKNFKINTVTFVTQILTSSVIVSFVLFYYYSPFVIQTSEIFELANPANSMMRIFKHAQIPFIDFMSSHMLNEQWYGILYFSIFGYNASLDFLSWEFFNQLIFFLIAFVFVKNIVKNSFLALLFIISMPLLSSLFFTNIFVCVVLFFVLVKLQANQTIRNYLLVYTTIILVIIWRLDTGATALISAFFYFPLVIIAEKTKINIKAKIKALAMFLGIVIVIFAIAFILRNPTYIFENFKTALHYITTNQAHGHYKLAFSQPHQFYVYYVIFPAVSILSILYIIYSLRKDYLLKSNMHKHYILKSSLFFFICYLANAQRGLVRHSFIEQTEGFLVSTFFIASSLLITYVFYSQRDVKRFFVFFGSTFLLFIVLKFFPFQNKEAMIESVLTKPKIQNMDLLFSHSTFKGRTIRNYEFEKHSFYDLRKFLDNNLKKDQSFIDFSNTPMLYYYCQRKVPGYFNQNLQNTVDDFLQLQYLKNVDTYKYPVVVFSNYPPNWFDKTDGVPNAMRYYLIADFIFSNYKPFRIISNKSIWVAKNKNFKTEITQIDTIINQHHIFNYQHSARFLGEFLYNEKNEFFDVIHYSKTEDNKENYNFSINLDTKHLNNRNLFLLLEIETENEYEINYLHLRSEDKYLGHFVFNLNKGTYRYAVRLSNNYLFHILQVNQLILDKQKGTVVKKIKLIKDKRI